MLAPLFRLGLRANLLLLMAFASIVLGADRLRQIEHDRNDAILAAEIGLLDRANRVAERHNTLFTDTRVVLSQAVRLPEAASASETACREPFQQILDDLVWLGSVAVVSLSGDVTCVAPASAVAVNLADRPYFRAALETGAFTLSDYLISRQTGMPRLAAAMPRLVDGRPQSVVIASIDLGWLARLAQQTESGAADILLLDRNGTVIVSPGLPGTAVGTTLDEGAFAVAPSGLGRTRAFDGRTRVVAYAPLEATGGMVAVLREESAIVAAANADIWISALAFLGMGILCGLLVWFGGQTFVLRPLRMISHEAGRFGGGDLTARVDTSRFVPEFAALGRSFSAMADRLAAQDAELRAANARLHDLAATDGMTGLANRRRFDEQLVVETARCARKRAPMSLIMVDIDHFKRFNDRYGHLAGDDCLRQVAATLRAFSRRPGDLAARTGGEEFSLLLPECGLADAAAIAEEIRAAIAAMAIAHQDGEGGHVSASIGVASLRIVPGAAAETLVHAADAALYAAKRGGRNRVARHEDRLTLVS
ncbi:MAG: diguanylate cyclase [Bauldia sp.]|nr:diguanylate cyclase [Bauldia sp.]